MESPTSPKVTVAVIAGAITTILVYLVRLFSGTEIPAEVATAITTVIMGIAAYAKRDPLRDEHDDNLRA